MAGLYLHIPFCTSRCIYCDFYSTTRSSLQRDFVHALCRELTERKEYLHGEPVKTIYFGGGTPSQLCQEEFGQIFHTIQEIYGIDAAEEITLEANPDDLTEEYVGMLRTLPFNRISMGIQTFHDPTLRLLHRRHTSRQAIEAVSRLRAVGFQNISIDLIYGLPRETDAQWQRDLEQALALDVEHISAYHLTYEEGTPIHRLLQTHHISEVDEESSLRFFSRLMDTLTAAGYEHYEISNFCKPHRHSRHNSAYWQSVPYLGCGPSAHSYNGTSRTWNAASLTDYLSPNPTSETEVLDTPTRYNEYVMTSLRTSRGASLSHIEETFGTSLRDYCRQTAAPYLQSGKLTLMSGTLRLTRAGLFISDAIISNLMSVTD